VDPEKENKQYLDQLEEKKGVQMMNQWTNIFRSTEGKDNPW
jgi:hypothetical protein